MALTISEIAESESFKKNVFFSLLSSKKYDPKQISSDCFKVLISAMSELLKAEKQVGFSDKMTVNYQCWMRYFCVQERF